MPIELEVELGPIPSAIIPLGGKPVLKYLIDFYGKNYFNISVSVQECKNEIIDYVESINDQKIYIDEIQNNSTLGNTIYESLDKLENGVEKLVINFADTLSNFPILDVDTIYFSDINEKYRWTTFKVNKNSDITNISDKFNFDDGNKTDKIFTGIFIIYKIEKFKEILFNKISSNKEKSKIDPFYIAIKEYFNSIQKSKKKFKKLNKWYDCGHLDTYYKTRRNFYKRERIFNSISIDESRGILTKKSKNKNKLIDEISWYRNLPNDLKYLSPRIYDYSIDPSNPFVKMEYYGYPVISDIYLFGSWNHGTWSCFFNDLHFILDEMKKRKVDIKKHKIIKAQKYMYINKTLNRLNEFKISSKKIFKPFTSSIKINKTQCLPLNEIIDKIPKMLDDLDIIDSKFLSVIHGDLCFSNILYDQKNRIIRTIDPRGSFGGLGIYGDIRYDYAKIQHSIIGDYDFFVNGLFELKWLSKKELLLKPNLKTKHIEIKRIYKKEFISNLRQYNQIRFIEGLLFLSMVPLHRDKPKSQIAFLANGLKILNDLNQN